jgi:16S rRNA pseudouridine516 synthase
LRLDKYLAESSSNTRKVIRNYIKEGNVTVNDRIILDPATEINENCDIIYCFGNRMRHPGKMYYMFHKPGGCITATKDVSNLTVLDYFKVNNGDGLFPVGRLDKDTEGLLLVTNDGEFCHLLMDPKKKVEKTYYFWVFGSLDQNNIEQLLGGVMIGDNEESAKAVSIIVEEEGRYQDLKHKMKLESVKDIKINPYHQSVTSGYITITEGRKHQVKRMLKSVGCYVVYLKRISIGSLVLDQTLKKGEYRELTKEELKNLNSLSCKCDT